MTYYVVVRGPLGVGKTTVAARLARELGAEHVPIDRILDENGLEEWESGYISPTSFLRANRIAIDRARPLLDGGTPVIFDGNFYWKSVIEDLVIRLDYPHYVFTLRAPLSVCIARDSRRDLPHGREAARAVFAKTTEFDFGIRIDADATVSDVVNEIRAHVARTPKGRTRRGPPTS